MPLGAPSSSLAARLRILERTVKIQDRDGNIVGDIVSAASSIHDLLDKANATHSHSLARAIRLAESRSLVDGRMSAKLKRLVHAANAARHITQFGLRSLVSEVAVLCGRDATLECFLDSDPGSDALQVATHAQSMAILAVKGLDLIMDKELAASATTSTPPSDIPAFAMDALDFVDCDVDDLLASGAPLDGGQFCVWPLLADMAAVAGFRMGGVVAPALTGDSALVSPGGGSSIHQCRLQAVEHSRALVDTVKSTIFATHSNPHDFGVGDLALHRSLGLVEVVRVGFGAYDGDLRVLRGDECTSSWTSGTWVRASSLTPATIGLSLMVAHGIPFVDEDSQLVPGSTGTIIELNAKEIVLSFWDLDFIVTRFYWCSLAASRGVA